MRKFLFTAAGVLLASVAQLPAALPFADGATVPVLGVPHLIRGDTSRLRGLPVRADAVITVPGAPEHLARRLTDYLKTIPGIKIIGPGDLCDDDSLPNAGDQMIGLITAGPYSAAHDSALNKTYVADFLKTAGERPDFASLGAYDGLHMVYEALKKTGGDADGDKLIAAMKGMAWESPRGPISLDADTRDIVSNIYIRKVEKINGELWAKEFETYPNVKDPMKVAAK